MISSIMINYIFISWWHPHCSHYASCRSFYLIQNRSSCRTTKPWTSGWWFVHIASEGRRQDLPNSSAQRCWETGPARGFASGYWLNIGWFRWTEYRRIYIYTYNIHYTYLSICSIHNLYSLRWYIDRHMQRKRRESISKGELSYVLVFSWHTSCVNCNILQYLVIR